MLNLAHTAPNKTKGLVLADLRHVLTMCDFAGLPSTSTVKVRVGFRGQITSIEIREVEE